MTDVEIKMKPGFAQRLQGRYEQYSFEVGVLENKTRKVARPKSAGLKVFAGSPARKTGKIAKITNEQVSKRLRKKYRINIFKKPFTMKSNVDINNMLKRFFDLIQGKSVENRLRNTLQAIVRNPIMRGDYGKNRAATASRKGFNKLMIDTAQFFKSITAKIIKKKR
jgi:hypothetical protein